MSEANRIRVIAQPFRKNQGSTHYLFDHLAVVEDEHRATFFVGNARFVVDAQRVINRGGDVGRAVGFAGRISRLLVAGSDDLSDLSSRAGEEDRTASAPMVAAAVLVDLRSATKLGERHDQR